MDKPPRNYHRQPLAEAIALIYLMVGVLWIVLSDKAVVHFVTNPEFRNVAHLYKGWFYILASALILYIALKRICGLISQAHEELVESSERLRLIFGQADEGIALLGEDMKFIDCNPGLCRIYGVESKADVIGRTVMDFTPERLRDGRLATEVIEELLYLVRNDEAPRFEWQHVQPSGALVDVEVSGKLIQLGGQPIIQAIVRDVTERKKIESAIALSEKKYRLLFENMTAGFVVHEVVFDDEGTPVDLRFIEVNPGFEKQTGLKVSEVLGRSSADLFPSSSVPRWLEAYEHVLATGEACSFETYSKALKRYLAVTAFVPKEGLLTSIIYNVTEHKKAEDEIREANEQLQYIIDNTHDVIFQIDLQGNYIYGNAAVEEMTGYTLDEMLKMNMFQVIVPEHVALVKEKLGKRLEGEHEQASYSFQIFHKDGHRLWLELTTSEVCDANGQLVAVQGIARDVSDRKRMKEALEQRIVSLTRPLNDPVEITFDELFNLDQIQRIQDEFAEATGVASIITDLQGNPITRGSYRTSMKGCRKCAESDKRLCRYHPDGPILQLCPSCGLRDAGVNIVVGGRHVANWLVGQVRDDAPTEEAMREHAREIEIDEEEYIKTFREIPVMSKKRFEKVVNALYSLANQLSSSAYMNLQQARFIADERNRTAELLRLSTAINQSAENVMITSADGVIQYVNPAFEKTTGYSRQEVIGQKPSLLKSGMHSDSFYREMWSCISSGKTWTGRMHNRRKDGTLFVEDATISPILNESDEIVNYVGLKRDVTRELNLEEQFRQAQKMEAIGRLASGVAHDFNNILQTILGYCGVLMMEMEGQEEFQQDVLEIQNSAKKAGRLTRQLLTFSRRQPAMQTQLDINQILTEQISMLRRLLDKNVSLIFEPAEELFPVKADESQIEQVVMNLVVNARDAMPQGGTITLSTRNVVYSDEVPIAGDRAKGREYLCITVSDTGMGIKKEVLDHLFEPFFTTKPVGEGTGLGLAIIYGIVDQHSGWIDVESALGEGSTFSIYLPKCSEQFPEGMDEENASLLAAQIPEDRRKKILLVEDDEQVRKLARMILREAGYAVTDADSAGHTEKLLQEQPQEFDLLLIDAVLPDRPGIELAEDLCGRSAASSSVIIFSGYSDARVRVDIIEEKGYKFLRKPFSTEALLEMVKAMLKEKSRGIR